VLFIVFSPYILLNQVALNYLSGKWGNLNLTKECPVYVTIISHNEERTSRFGRLDYEEGYLEFRNSLLRFANMLKKHEAKYNWQSEMRFLRSVEKFDKGTVLESTNGKNIVRYLKEDLGFEVDPHCHEVGYVDGEIYNYADIAYMMERLGVIPSKVVGGFLLPPENRHNWKKFRQPITAVLNDYVWKPEILWGGAAPGHRDNKDDFSSGIWRPKDKHHFSEHDENANLIYVGTGCLFDKTLRWLDNLVSKIKDDLLPANRIYTASFIMIEDHLLNGGEESFCEWESIISKLSRKVHEGDIVWSGLSEVVEIWKKKFGAEPNRYLDKC